MAKKFQPKTSGVNVDAEVQAVTETEGVENPVETVEKTTVEETKAPEIDDVDINPDVEQKSAVKNVKILPNKNHSCSIGGVRYNLKKDVQTNVPLEVKEILRNAGLLKTL
jgi:hypothetical protein